jgi:hypothetical protein
MHDGMLLEDFLDASNMLVVLARDPKLPRRTMHPADWVDELIAQADDQQTGGMFGSSF